MRQIRDFSVFGQDTREMIISQLGSIDLDRIGPKSISSMGKSLIKLISQSHRFQEEVSDPDIQKEWVTIREMSLSILEAILARFQTLSDQAEIAEWDRSTVLGLLADISKVCHEEQKRTDEQLKGSMGKELSSELLEEMLNSP